jgi:ribosomal subunit interface protein
MDIRITARQCTVPDSLRNQAEQRLARMARIDGRVTGATMVFESQHATRTVEARLAIAGGPPLVGQGAGATLRNAMDRALDRLDRQLKRRRDRVVARRTRARRDVAAP